MIRVQRVEGRESVVHRGRHFTLVSWTWTLSIGGPGFGIGWRYHHPHRVESSRQATPVLDYVFLARAVAALLLVAATLFKRRADV